VPASFEALPILARNLATASSPETANKEDEDDTNIISIKIIVLLFIFIQLTYKKHFYVNY
jgi:hypothetical protein